MFGLQGSTNVLDPPSFVECIAVDPCKIVLHCYTCISNIYTKMQVGLYFLSAYFLYAVLRNYGLKLLYLS